MSTFKSEQEVLDFAIKNEQEAADFYRNLAGQTKSPVMKKNLESFAKEEDGHKKALMAVKEGSKRLSSKRKSSL